MNLLHSLNLPEQIKELSISKLKQLADEIREELITVVSLNGGHLASNLGVVELTLAIYYVFDIPKDRLIFDVSHQSYVHKMLSGRLDKFSTIRKFQGLSGFMNPLESEFDPFVSGHSSTAVSLGCGFARSDILQNRDNITISVVGDGALTGGLCYEALNEVKIINGRQVIIINDNNMSISGNVGSTSRYLKKLRISKTYINAKNKFNKFIEGFKFKGNKVSLSLQSMKNSVKYLINGKLPFDQYGIPYYGPIDGHNIEDLITFLKHAEQIRSPFILHIITTKGNGYQVAELEPQKFHSVSGKCHCKKVSEVSFSDTVGKKLLTLAEIDPKIVATTAAMTAGTGLADYSRKFPHRFFDVGICEEHAVTMNAAMAKGGLKPYFCVYSTFLQRALDNIIHDVSILSLPVRFLIDRAGLVGEDGSTHHGIFDISFMSLVPNMTIITPANKAELEKMLDFSRYYDKPLAIRYPKSATAIDFDYGKIEYGQWKYLVNRDSEVVALCVGADMIANAYLAKDKTKLPFDIVNCSFIKPLDEKLLLQIKGKKIITIEDNVHIGGFGSQVADFYAKNRINVDMKILAIEYGVVEHGSKDDLYNICGLSENHIISAVDSYAKA